MNNEKKSQSTFPTSPDWSTAPEWAQWFAIDGDMGHGHWFGNMPDLDGCIWYNPYGNTQYAGKFNATNWRNSRQPRPTTP